MSRYRKLPRMASMAGTRASSTEEAMEKIRMDRSIMTNKKLVPQRGWSRVCFRTFSTVRGSPAS